jgi:NAD(P)-dependent dehydrogenase (short-subunit alcohol dehydrogenase family)
MCLFESTARKPLNFHNFQAPREKRPTLAPPFTAQNPNKKRHSCPNKQQRLLHSLRRTGESGGCLSSKKMERAKIKKLQNEPDFTAGGILLITGATGIAAATARLAVEAGARVFIAALPGGGVEALAAETNSGFYAGDLAQEPHAESAIRACLDRHGRLDALFNVAGISGRSFGDGPVHECAAEAWDRTLNANARSTFLMCRAAVRQMIGQQSGSILNMASVLAFSPEPRHFASHAYAASKGAIIALTTAMAACYAPMKIRVNAIAPGLVDTPMSRRARDNEEIRAFIEHKQPLASGMLNAGEIARTALFLLSGGASSITGQIVTVDGGWCVSA